MSDQKNRPINAIPILKTLNIISEKGGNVPHRLAESFATANRETEPGMAAHMRALSAYQNGDYASAIEFMEQSLRAELDNAELFCRNRSLSYRIVEKVEALGLEKSTSGEFLRNYDLLVRIGEATLECHLSASQGYNSLGDVKRACAIAGRLLKVAPGFPGLKNLCEKLGLIQNTTERKAENGNPIKEKKNRAA
jgi:tetratricopeptide (TPR) repeat protein